MEIHFRATQLVLSGEGPVSIRMSRAVSQWNDHFLQIQRADRRYHFTRHLGNVIVSIVFVRDGRQPCGLDESALSCCAN